MVGGTKTPGWSLVEGYDWTRTVRLVLILLNTIIMMAQKRKRRMVFLNTPPLNGRHLTQISRSALVTVLWPLVLAGCVSIDSFQASPRNVCAGDTVTVAWHATGHVELEAKPALAHTGSKPSVGEEQFLVQQTTRFVLNAQCLFSHKTAEADVVVVANAPKEFGGLASCMMPEQRLTLSLPLQEPQVSSALRVTSVTNMNARPIVLSKENVQVTLLPAQTSTAFEHQAALGAWEVTASLNPNETCEDALAAVRDRLTFRIAFSCRE